MSQVMGFNELLGRRVRTGPWEDQAVSTYRKIHEAVTDGRWDDAAALADYFVDEAKVLYDLCGQLLNDIRGFLGEKGTPVDEIAAADARILSRLTLPDGEPFDAPRLWAKFLAEVQGFVKSQHGQQTDRAVAQLDAFKETWRRLHDRNIDHAYGLIQEVARRYGEPTLGEMYQRTMSPLFATRYGRFDISKHPWDQALDTLLHLAMEAMRAHLVGPQREGNIEFVEEPDRYAVRFDPCGSGGRAMRGDAIEGTGPRMEPPYNYGVTQQEYDWAWNKKGVCYYCAHCCVVMEQMPIDAFGYPVRVVEPPTYPDAKDAKCTWYMYKDPTKVPEEYYRRVGRTKPTSFGSNATDKRREDP